MSMGERGGVELNDVTGLNLADKWLVLTIYKEQFVVDILYHFNCKIHQLEFTFLES